MPGDKLEKELKEIINKKPSEITQQEWVELICTNCQFYHPEEEEKQECAGFKILKELALNGKINLAQLNQIAKKISFKKNE